MGPQGQRAFGAPDILETYKKVSQGLYAPPREFVPDLPYHISTTIERALDIDPNRRYSDCDSFGRALFKSDDWPTSLNSRSPGYAVASTMKAEAEAATGTANNGPPSIMTKGSDQALAELTGSQVAPAAQGKSNTALYAGVGVAVLGLLGVLFVVVLGVTMFVLNG